MIRPWVTGSVFLDLYAGTGASGLEALSRGAQKAVFVELDRACVKVIERNVAHLGFGEQAVVVRANVLSGLEWLKYHSHEGFDIVFMGPPYRDEENLPLHYTSKTLELAAAGNILSPGGFIVAQHHIKEPVAAPPGYGIYREVKYGDTLVSLLRRAGAADAS
jgi:16S rRNA (guanine(966)-N(2))-methyltransferase RsmD